MIAALSLVNLESGEEVSGFSPPERFVRHIEVPWTHRGLGPQGTGLRSNYTGAGREVILVEAVFHGGAEADAPTTFLRALEPLRSMTTPGKHGYPPPCLLIHADESETVVFDHLAVELRLNEGIALVAMRLSVLTDREKLDRVVANVPATAGAALSSSLRIPTGTASPVTLGVAGGDAAEVLTRGRELVDRSNGDIKDLEYWFGKVEQGSIKKAAEALHASGKEASGTPAADATRDALADWEVHLNDEAGKLARSCSSQLAAVGLPAEKADELAAELEKGARSALQDGLAEIRKQILAVDQNPTVVELRTAAERIDRSFQTAAQDVAAAWGGDANAELAAGRATQESTGAPQPASSEPRQDLRRAQAISARRVIEQDRDEGLSRRVRVIATRVQSAIAIVGSATVKAALAKRAVDDRAKRWSERHRTVDDDPLVQGVMQTASRWEDDVKHKLDAQLTRERGRLAAAIPKGGDAVRREVEAIVSRHLPQFVKEVSTVTERRLRQATDQVTKEVSDFGDDLEKSRQDVEEALRGLERAWEKLGV